MSLVGADDRFKLQFMIPIYRHDKIVALYVAMKSLFK